MVSLRHRLYWKAPPFVKNWLASWNARNLDAERYGPEREEILRQIAEHDQWSAAQFVEYQRRELRELVRHAARNVPYYRRLFADRGIDPERIEGPEDLVHLPILEKQTLRADPVSLVDERLDRKKLVVGHTSGTTGTPVVLYRSVWLNSSIFAYFDARCHEIEGMCRRRNRSMSVGVHLVTHPARTKPPFWVHNRRWRQLYMSSCHLAPRYLDAYVEEIRTFQPEYIEGYPSCIYAIASHIVENGLEPIPVKACFCTAETLFDHHRRAIREAFCCRTCNQYGCGETVVFAAECKEGSMHLSPEVGIVEVVDDDDRPVEPGQVGQLVCTSLVNKVQPLIRYRVGDTGSLGTGPCGCGSPLPLLGQIGGRIDDVVVTRDGRRIGRLDPVFKDVQGIVEAQIVQNDYDRFVMRIVPGKDYTDADGRTAVSNLSRRVGDADIRVELVDRVERTSSGKFKAVICNLPRERASRDAEQGA